MEHLTLVILFGAYHYGGAASPFLPWLVPIPIIAVLHFGRYIGLREPGMFLMIPVVDTLSPVVDQRVRVSSVSADPRPLNRRCVGNASKPGSSAQVIAASVAVAPKRPPQQPSPSPQQTCRTVLNILSSQDNGLPTFALSSSSA